MRETISLLLLLYILTVFGKRTEWEFAGWGQKWETDLSLYILLAVSEPHECDTYSQINYFRNWFNVMLGYSSISVKGMTWREQVWNVGKRWRTQPPLLLLSHWPTCRERGGANRHLCLLYLAPAVLLPPSQQALQGKNRARNRSQSKIHLEKTE